MSAFHTKRLKNTSVMTDVCCEPKCFRQGRYTFSIHGIPILSENPTAPKGTAALLCKPHAEEAERIWAGALDPVEEKAAA